jgi:hypothetical protein
MSWGGLARYEWILIELVVLGILVWQLISVNRASRGDREKAKTPERNPEGE